MNLRTQAEEFFVKAKELGMIDDVDQKLELRKNVKRLEVVAKIKALPKIEQTELPAVSKAAVAAHKALELAEEAYRAADRNYKYLSQRAYGLQNQFEGARWRLENEAQALAPDFLRTAWEDMGYLDGLVSARFGYQFETVYSFRTGNQTITTSNAEAITASRNNIKAARERVMAMMLEDTSREVAQAEVATMFAKLETEAYAISVQQQAFEGRRKPVDVAAKAEEHAAREQKERSRQREARRSQMTTIRP